MRDVRKIALCVFYGHGIHTEKLDTNKILLQGGCSITIPYLLEFRTISPKNPKTDTMQVVP